MEAIIPSTSIERLLKQRNLAVEQARSAHSSLAASLQTCRESGIGDLTAPFAGGIRTMTIVHHEWLAMAIATIDARAWDLLMRESGMFTFLDSTARSEWRKAIDTCSTPPLTADNIKTTFASLYAERGDMFERGVLQIYRALSWNFRTNRGCKFGKKVIIHHILNVWGFGADSACNAVDDLNRAFHLLAGKPEPDHRNGLATRMRQAPSFTAQHIDNEFIQLRVFPKARTAHVRFKRPDLVDRLNGILAKHHPDALPAPH
ncbi:DUF4942 domain-containing protein [Crenobacter sp. SG2305]|uniref:DUF4942 domain-containing protein n=1 Tax=Crenobacter oryzisoli TaxID=3056844 RepID=UPI0025AB304C|nr:DUF4942 domain-containing protein [Crenobacter sp. SG2305]MDN0082435.1 DUF4942 domain-containing protein [Crenobacter sp. SG2305]